MLAAVRDSDLDGRPDASSWSPTRTASPPPVPNRRRSRSGSARGNPGSRNGAGRRRAGALIRIPRSRRQPGDRPAAAPKAIASPASTAAVAGSPALAQPVAVVADREGVDAERDVAAAGEARQGDAPTGCRIVEPERAQGRPGEGEGGDADADAGGGDRDRAGAGEGSGRFSHRSSLAKLAESPQAAPKRRPVRPRWSLLIGAALAVLVALLIAGVGREAGRRTTPAQGLDAPSSTGCQYPPAARSVAIEPALGDAGERARCPDPRDLPGDRLQLHAAARRRRAMRRSAGGAVAFAVVDGDGVSAGPRRARRIVPLGERRQVDAARGGAPAARRRGPAARLGDRVAAHAR